MSDGIDALQSPENGKTFKGDRAATAIGSVLEAPEYSQAAATSISTLPAAESALSLGDSPSPTTYAFGDRTVVGHPQTAESQPPVDQPGTEEPAIEAPANETDEAAAHATPDYPDHPYAQIIPPIVGSGSGSRSICMGARC